MADLFDSSEKIVIDGRWDLEDLYSFPRAYEQVYFAINSMIANDEAELSRIQRAYSSMPWQGGYSAVNFYSILRFNTPKKKRPVIASLKYASEGWIELAQVSIITAGAIAAIVKSMCYSIDRVNSTYNNIHRGLSERKMLGIADQKAEIELAKKYLSFLKESNREMADILQVENLDRINSLTGNELKTLKIFLSVFRRLKVLCDFQLKGKIKL